MQTPKHVSSGIVVLNVMWSLIRGVSQEGDCTSHVQQVKDHFMWTSHAAGKRSLMYFSSSM